MGGCDGAWTSTGGSTGSAWDSSDLSGVISIKVSLKIRAKR